MAHNTLLTGIVGSTAYGLATADSDIDLLGIFALDTTELHGLAQPDETVCTTQPDITLHEAAKWCRLALAGNPTVTELVWLPHELYQRCTPLGEELINLRTTLLSAPRVRAAYLGYAAGQFRKLQDRGDGSFSADTRKRTAKHARHLMRLCHQGHELYATGHLTLRVDNPQAYHDFGDQVVADPDAAVPLLAHYEDLFATTRSPLPDQADPVPVEAWLHRVRARFFRQEATS